MKMKVKDVIIVISLFTCLFQTAIAGKLDKKGTNSYTKTNTNIIKKLQKENKILKRKNKILIRKINTISKKLTLLEQEKEIRIIRKEIMIPKNKARLLFIKIKKIERKIKRLSIAINKQLKGNAKKR